MGASGLVDHPHQKCKSIWEDTSLAESDLNCSYKINWKLWKEEEKNYRLLLNVVNNAIIKTEILAKANSHKKKNATFIRHHR